MKDFENDTLFDEEISEEVESESEPEFEGEENKPESKRFKRLSQIERTRQMLEREREEKNRLISDANEAKRIAHEAQRKSEELAILAAEDREKLLDLYEAQYRELRSAARQAGDEESLDETEDKILNIKLERKKLKEMRETSAINRARSGDQQTVQQLELDTRPVPTVDDLKKQERMEKFLERFPFIDPANNAAYNPELQAKASKISSDLATQYKLEGKGNKILSREYLNDLGELLNEEVQSIKSKIPLRSTDKPMQESRRTAPVSSSFGSTENRGNTSKFVLTHEEERMVKNASKHMKYGSIEDLKKNIVAMRGK
jgi:hypothetical protein